MMSVLSFSRMSFFIGSRKSRVESRKSKVESRESKVESRESKVESRKKKALRGTKGFGTFRCLIDLASSVSVLPFRGSRSGNWHLAFRADLSESEPVAAASTGPSLRRSG